MLTIPIWLWIAVIVLDMLAGGIIFWVIFKTVRPPVKLVYREFKDVTGKDQLKWNMEFPLDDIPKHKYILIRTEEDVSMDIGAAAYEKAYSVDEDRTPAITDKSKQKQAIKSQMSLIKQHLVQLYEQEEYESQNKRPGQVSMTTQEIDRLETKLLELEQKYNSL